MQLSNEINFSFTYTSKLLIKNLAQNDVNNFHFFIPNGVWISIRLMIKGWSTTGRNSFRWRRVKIYAYFTIR